MTRLTPVELAAAISVLSCTLVVLIPSCARSVRMSRTAEATENLETISRAFAQHANDPGVTLPTPLTPALVPRGSPAADPPGTWDHPTWRAIGFSIPEDNTHWFSYMLDARDPGREVSAIAHGDLDGDGVLSTYTRVIRREPTGWTPSGVLLVTADLE